MSVNNQAVDLDALFEVLNTLTTAVIGNTKSLVLLVNTVAKLSPEAKDLVDGSGIGASIEKSVAALESLIERAPK